VRTPWWVKQFFRSYTWQLAARGREIYLSFDDGPHPEVTPFVLDCLHQANAKASFFCIGKNVELYPEIFSRIVSEGHTAGNHSYSHPDGWKMDVDAYVDDVQRSAQLVGAPLFRPPYGRITSRQAARVRGFSTIVMWTVLSGDFDSRITAEECANNVKQYAAPGSIIVFHDSEKAFPRLRYALPSVLDELGKLGYVFKAMPYV